MARNKITQLLTSPDKGVNRTTGVNGVLSRMFRIMLLDNGINPMRWGVLMHSFINDVRNGVPNNKRDQTSIRGNITKEFARPQMTWKVFVKAMRFLHIVHLKITIEATHAGKPNPTIHTVNVPLGNISMQQMLEDTAEPEIEGELEDEPEDAEEREQNQEQGLLDLKAAETV